MESAVETTAAMIAASVKPEKTGGRTPRITVGITRDETVISGYSPRAAIPRRTGNRQMKMRIMQERIADL